MSSPVTNNTIELTTTVATVDTTWLIFFIISLGASVTWFIYWAYEVWPHRHICFKASIRATRLPDLNFFSGFCIRALSVGLTTFAALNLFYYGDFTKDIFPTIPYVSKSVLAVCAILLEAYFLSSANKFVRDKIRGNE